MCRHLAYLGPDLAPSALVLDPPHSLLKQSYAARELLAGVVNADGFGVAWYRDEAGPEPAVYRSILPIWADRDLPTLAPRVRGHAILANVRNATEAGTTDRANIHPFDHGRFTFTHNGYIDHFRSEWMRTLRSGISDTQYAALRGVTDSETIFRCILTQVEEGASPREAIATVTEDLIRRTKGKGAVKLNFLLSDGVTLWATRAGSGPCNSLYTLVDGARFPRGTVVASEPLDDDPKWKPVPEQHLVVAHGGEPIELVPL